MNEIELAPDLLSVVVARTLAEEHVADIVETLNEQDSATIAHILQELPFERAVEVLDQPELADAAEALALLPEDRAGAFLTAMSADRAADVFQDFDDETRQRLSARLDRQTRTDLGKLLAYPEHSAGSIMTTEFVSVPSTWTVQQTLDYIRRVERSRETVYAIYVLDPATKKLVRAVSLRRLISGDPAAPVESVVPAHKPITVTPEVDREDVARLITKYDLLSVPVVDAEDRIIGIVTFDDVIDAMIAETTEDVQKLGGMEALDEPYNEIGFLAMIRKRAGWLSILLLGEMLTASAMQFFQTELEKAIVLTLFIPLIMSSGGNSGSQATSLIIRALALREITLKDWWRVILRELPSGLVLGSILGAIGIVRIALWQWLGFYDYGPHWMLIAATVGGALIGIVTFGSMMGSMLPFLLKRAGFDPASASAPLVATLVDVTGLVIYFGVAALILSGTLL
ncbi:magnesium transporter [Bosea sp. SSUT16]|jgi:magnesium transporter|uniref:Magnesium transporter MgtE n=1 Tax=Bosea spartocytisi TaxID=2773451 RepID=A0A927ECP5_9HYPH|nr:MULTISPECIES: magnesium transporter [Bosea]MBD3848017.1 magnesium transporter [Bosea spartocytisi]MCT4470138.1 magnesium transporter [Bosea spartocytisi]